MNDNKYINNITLECLLNPNLYNKIYNDKKSESPDKSNDILFYRKRICQLTKDMCKGEYNNTVLQNIFMNYATSLVYYFKQEDFKDIYQKEYEFLENKSDFDLSTNNTHDYQELDIANHLLVNKPSSINNLDNFVKKLNVNLEPNFLPSKREINQKDPALKYKGIKNKSHNNIDGCIKEKVSNKKVIKEKVIKEKVIKENVSNEKVIKEKIIN